MLETLPVAGGLELEDFQCPFQPKPFYHSMICLMSTCSVILLHFNSWCEGKS